MSEEKQELAIDQDPRKREPMAPREPQQTGMALIEVAGNSMELRARAFEQLTEYQRNGVLKSAAQQIAATGWGKNVSPDMRRDVARYALSVGTDPVRHWEILGGRLYDRAELWLDLVTSQDEYDGHDFDYVHDDDRLSDEERAKRKEMRAKFGVPEDVKGACVVAIYRTDRPRPSLGINWAGNRKCYVAAQKKEGVKLDPIGEQEPSKTAFTRAFRRAAKTAFPLYFRRTKMKEREEGVPLTALDRTEARLQEERLAAKEQKKALPPWHNAPGGESLEASGDNLRALYGMEETDEPSRQEDDQEAPVSPEAGAQTEDQETEILREDLKMSGE